MYSNRHRHWVCFSCRKQLRKSVPLVLQPRYKLPERVYRETFCPVCHAEMIDMGGYFRPPRRSDKRGWDEMHKLAEQGVRFCGKLSNWRWGLKPRVSPALRAAESRMSGPSEPANEGKRLLRKIANKPVK